LLAGFLISAVINVIVGVRWGDIQGLHLNGRCRLLLSYYNAAPSTAGYSPGKRYEHFCVEYLKFTEMEAYRL
jgi:hypothetical protein